MLVITRKNNQKIMINDNIVITVVESKFGQCKLAIQADKDVKIYREEIYYQIKLANLVGKDTNVNAVDSVSDMIKQDGAQLNKEISPLAKDNDIELVQNESKKKIIIKKKENPNQ